jgi:hypothetical protein
MSASAHPSSACDTAGELAIDTMRPVALVAHDLGIRAEVELPRRPGVVDQARAIAGTLGVRATILVRAGGICVRFSPASR